MRALLTTVTLLCLGIFPSPAQSNSCGDGLCTPSETKQSCKADCDENTCRALYQDTKEACLKNGWQELTINVNGIEREILWKAPKDRWINGAIITLHGGEGVHSNFCAPIPKELKPNLSDTFRGAPVANFGEMAIKNGFAVFSLNSGFNRGTDAKGISIGKRWLSFSQNGDEQFELDFIEAVLDQTIPGLRPQNSNKNIFMTGISNGAFMTTLAASHFNDKITAFAPVAGGDPYGMYFDMSQKKLLKRKCGPGTFRDFETNKEIHHRNSCKSQNYPHELQWPAIKRRIKFKQFYHIYDGGIHYSCMEKARQNLIKQGFIDAGKFVLKKGYWRRNLEAHFWHEDYNKPILDFFKNQ